MIFLSQPAPKLKIPFLSLPHNPRPSPLSSTRFHHHTCRCFSHHNGPKSIPPTNCNSRPTGPKTHLIKPLPKPSLPNLSAPKKGKNTSTSHGSSQKQQQQMWVLCGFGYWVHGVRCFPWLALNFHLAHGLGLSPSTLQLVQHTVNLPMIAKPFYGVISDALYIGDAHRVPYISFGAFLQVVSWGTLALIPVTGDTFPTQIAFILLGNLGASFTEVVGDALLAKFSKSRKSGVLQSYAFMALAAGGILGNLSGGFFLIKTQQPKALFFTYAFLLTIQLALSLTTKESSLYSPRSSNRRSLVTTSISETLSNQFSDLMTAINEEKIFQPLLWVVASTAIVPLLSGPIFCFQTQCLKLDPSVIGLSKVIGQLLVLFATVIYNKYLKRVPLRKLIFGVQILYALSFLSDLFLVNQINLKLGVSNKAYVLCLSALAEAVAQFKLLPFSVLFASLCPPGSEGSLFAFFASAVCLSSILGGFFGVVLSSLIRVSPGDYSGLSLCILLQFIAALLPLGWISHLPSSRVQTKGKEMKRARKSLTTG